MADLVVCFRIPGKPVGKGRPRFDPRTRHAYTDQNTKDYESKVAWLFMNEFRKLPAAEQARAKAGDVAVKIEVGCPIPKSDSKKIQFSKAQHEIYPRTKPDIDNVCKIILDGLNKLAYNDDTQVVQINAYKQYDPDPHVSVKVAYVFRA